MLKNSQISKNFNPNEEILKHFMRSKERAALRKLLRPPTASYILSVLK